MNITDGLDGLAGGSFLVSLGVILILIPSGGLNERVMIQLFSMTAGFLLFNIRPAKTFMGDTGSHFLGGALAALCVMNGRTFAVIPAGFIFIIDMLSSAIHYTQATQKNIPHGTVTPSLSEKRTRRNSRNYTLLDCSCCRSCIAESSPHGYIDFARGIWLYDGFCLADSLHML